MPDPSSVDAAAPGAPAALGPQATFVIGAAGLAATAAAIITGPRDIGEVSRRRYGRVNVVLPADAAFGIWAPIYTGLGALLVYQALPAQRGNPRLRRAGPWLAAAPAGNAAWIALTQRERTGPAFVLIWGLLGGALGLHRALGIGREEVAGAERWLRVPASLYAGWLSVAQLPSLVDQAVDLGWAGRPPAPALWGTAALLGAAGVGAWAVRRLDDPWYGAAFVNAFVGIAARQAGSPGRAEARSRAVAVVAGALAAAGAAWLLRRAAP